MNLSKRWSGAGLVMLLIIGCSVGSVWAQQAPAELPASEAPAQPQLAAELLERMEEDQAARRMFTDLSKESKGKSPQEIEQEFASITQHVLAIDKRNRLWLAEKVKEFGWPGKTLVGERAAHAAWLLVQHADADPEFQELCLEKMKAAAAGEVAPVDIAYLTDRVLVARGRPQVYGTQCEEVEGRFQPRACIEPEALDERRKAVGLAPIKDYLRQMEEYYHARDEQAARDK